jgi:hypothetical protein
MNVAILAGGNGTRQIRSRQRQGSCSESVCVHKLKN